MLSHKIAKLARVLFLLLLFAGTHDDDATTMSSGHQHSLSLCQQLLRVDRIKLEDSTVNERTIFLSETTTFTSSSLLFPPTHHFFA
jgi:hypothetical protein